jgi:RNA ligase (TIGR02306 family)
MRKLASIQKIAALEPIIGADVIEKATVLGWQLVVKKGEFQVGDWCVYCEIDSVLPDYPVFEWVRARGARIRTVRLRGQISQGICFSTDILPVGFPLIEDTDCTEVLGITKYEPPIPASLAGLMKAGFPSFVPKTDETRVQTLQAVLDKYTGERCFITEKLDGSSATFFLRNGEFGVCSRNMELVEDDTNTFWKVAKMLHLKEKMALLGGNYALQGELVGEGIQSNKLKIKGHNVFFFNLFDIDRHVYVSFANFKDCIEKMNLQTVPIISNHTLLPNNIGTLVDLSKRKSLLNANTWAEGIVVRSVEEKTDTELANALQNRGRLSFKVINPEFLLKYDE